MIRLKAVTLAIALQLVPRTGLPQESPLVTMDVPDGVTPTAAKWIITGEDMRLLGTGDVEEILRLVTSNSAECTDPIVTIYGGVQWLVAECGIGTPLHTLRFDPSPESRVDFPFVFLFTASGLRPIVEEQPFDIEAADAYREFQAMEQPELDALVQRIRRDAE